MPRLSKHQLFCLIILFETGSTTLFALGIEAKQDAWIAILIAMAAGLVLLWLLTTLQKHYPDKNLAEIVMILSGKYLGAPLALLYALYFLYISSRNLRDFGELIVTSSLVRTPLLAVLIVFIIGILYVLYLGIEVFCRTSEIIMPIFLFFILSTFFMVIISEYSDIKEVLPILSEGFKPVLKEAFPLILTFPFGEMVVFLMYWQYTNSTYIFRKTSFLAVGISGLLLVCSVLIIITTLGADYAYTATIPLLQVVKTIDVQGFITNMDAVVVVIMLIGGFYKAAIFFYAGLSIISTVFNIKDRRWFIVPIGIYVLWQSVYIAHNYHYHVWVGLKIVTKYMHIPFQIVIPALLLLISYMKMLSNKPKKTAC